VTDEQREIRCEVRRLGLRQVRRQRQRRAAVVAIDDGGQALEQVAFRSGQFEQAFTRVSVRIDETRRDDQSRGVNAAGGRRSSQAADANNSSVRHGNVARHPRRAAAVDNSPAGDQQVERRRLPGRRGLRAHGHGHR